ncbi:nucleoside-diphosphate sugar epimerase/dehydratase [soil metagenome]
MTATPARTRRRGDLQPMERLAPGLVFAHDIFVAALSLLIVLVVRYRFEHKAVPEHLIGRSVLAFVLVCAVVFPVFRLQRGMWRFTALNDIARLGLAAGAASLLLVPVLFVVNRLTDFPRSTPLLLFPVLLAGLALGRGAIHQWRHGDLAGLFRLQDPQSPSAVIVGEPKAVATYLTALRRRAVRPVRVAGLITEGGEAAGRAILGVVVLGGLDELTAVLRRLRDKDGRAPTVVVADPRPPRALLDRVVAAAAVAGAQVSRVRGETGGAEIATVSAADLLARPPRSLDGEGARALIAGKRVLVTGAGGTIGGELTRQALSFGPAGLALVDASEFNLYAIDHELRTAHPELFVDGRPLWTTHIGDVRDEARMAALFASERPQVVLHAAALKHVPLMETNPVEAVRTNVGGAVVMARLAREHAECFVFISTDKAVNPTNVMGATKRLAEQAVLSLSAGSPLRAAAVRFGNVLGSSGSVAPLFERQIAEGGPVTVTHPEMVRYFMTVQEAAGLVLQAAAIAHPADTPEGACVYVLDMGDPVRIDDLARQMIALHGLRPDVDIAIRYTGLRPGEKLYEEVFYDAETVNETQAPGVMSAVDPAPAWAVLEPLIAELMNAAEAQDADETMRRLREVVPQFQNGD